MALRVVWTFVLMIWVSGPLAGGACLGECPEPAAAAVETCHASAPGAAFTTAHDCGTHVEPAWDVVVGTARKDLTPAPSVHVTAPQIVTAVRVTEFHALFDSPPPTRFLIPLRQ